MEDKELLMEESPKDVANAVIKTGKNAINKGGDMYVNGLNKRANMVATKMTEKDKPKEGDSEEVYAKYKASYAKWKQSYKTAEVLAIKGVLFGPLAPFDWLFTAVAGSGILRSTDPDDAKLQEIFKKTQGMLSKLKEMVSKTKAEEINKKDVDRGVNALNINCLKLAKGVDHFKAAKRENVPKVASAHFNSKPVKESTDEEKESMLNSVREILIKESGEINDISFETVSRMIDHLECGDEKSELLIECCLDVIDEACKDLFE